MEQHCKQMSLVGVGSARSVWATLRLPPLMACAFLVYIAQDPGCPVGELSGAGPKWRALPRSTPLRFRFSGTPQRGRLCWACVLCPSQVRVAQATRCLARALSSGAVRPSYRLPRPRCLVSWVRSRTTILDVPCVSSGELISGCHPPDGCQPSRIPGRLG